MAAHQELGKWVRGTLWSGLVGLYGMIIVVCGIVLPLSDFLSGAANSEGSSVIFMTYICLVSVIFMVYMEIYITLYIRHAKGSHGSQVHRQAGFTSGPHAGTEVDQTEEIFIPKLADVSEGVNFYMRMGALVFGVGALLLDAFFLNQFRENYDYMMACYGARFIIMSGSRMLFSVIQIIFIFRQHRLVANFHREVVKLGVMHLMAANISIWAFAVIFEANHSMSHNAHASDHGSGHAAEDGHHDNQSVTTADPHHSGVQMSQDAGGHSADSNAVSCVSSGESLFSLSSPYLFPLVIEFVLIGTTVAYRIYTSIGGTINPDFLRIMLHRTKEAKEDATGCRKKNAGIILGLVILVLAIVSTVYFNVVEERNDSSLVSLGTIYNYYLTDNVAQFLGLGLVLLCFWKVSKLFFHGKAENQLDQTLLLVTLFGLLLLEVLMIISATSALPVHIISSVSGTFVRLQITLCILTMVQSCAQVAFIFDAMRRCSCTEEDVASKPGRMLITILLLSNLAMWVINTFQLKETQTARMFTDYYGNIGWSIIFNMALPLAIFFRFHSSVCLSDVVLTLYHMDEEETVKSYEKFKREDEMF